MFLQGSLSNTIRQAMTGGALSLDNFFNLSNMECQIRASADDRLFGLWSTTSFPASFETIVIDGTTVESHYDHSTRIPLVPGPDGRSIFTGTEGIVTTRGEPITRVVKDPASPVNVPMPYVTSTDSTYYFMIKGLPPSNGPPRLSTPPSLSIVLAGHEVPLTTITHLGEMVGLTEDQRRSTRNKITIDRRFHWVPAANLLNTIPTGNDRLVLRRFDVGKELEEQGGDYLLVASPTSVTATAGRTFSHRD
jgi:hypothetical protein